MSSSVSVKLRYEKCLLIRGNATSWSFEARLQDDVSLALHVHDLHQASVRARFVREIRPGSR
jgi:hypothetical protein